MTPDEPSDEPTPLMPAALSLPPAPVPAEVPASAPSPTPAEPVHGPAAAPVPPPRARGPWRLLVAPLAASLTWALLDPTRMPEPPRAVAVTGAEAPAPSPQADSRPVPEAPPAPAPPPRRSPPRRPRAPGSVPRVAPSPARAHSPVEAARARYLAGDLAGARAVLAGVPGDAAAAVSARLDAVTRLVGEGDGWPPPGGAAALDRLLEIDAGLAPPGTSLLALRARRSLADHLAEKGRGLADEGRWEEALGAFREALDLERAHAGAAAGLDRVEAEAEARYLEAYAGEDVDLAAAIRLYRRAARLARPGGPLAGRIGRALERLSRR